MTTLHKYLTPDDFVIIIKPIKEEENRNGQEKFRYPL